MGKIRPKALARGLREHSRRGQALARRRPGGVVQPSGYRGARPGYRHPMAGAGIPARL